MHGARVCAGRCMCTDVLLIIPLLVPFHCCCNVMVYVDQYKNIIVTFKFKLKVYETFSTFALFSQGIFRKHSCPGTLEDYVCTAHTNGYNTLVPDAHDKRKAQCKCNTRVKGRLTP